MNYICIGVPYWLGERQQVAAVDAVKDSGIAGELGTVWIDLQPDFAAHADPVAAVNLALAQTIQAYPDRKPLVFAGECVTALGALKGLEAQRPAVLWYDAHGDFNTPETTPSGFLGGMPLAALVGMGNEALMQAVALEPVPQADVILTDARDLDPAEEELLRHSEVKHLRDLDALLTLDLPDKPLYVHFDTDVVSHAEMPAMNYPAAGGPSVAQTEETFIRVLRDAEIAGILFSLWNQTKPGADRALANTLRFARLLMHYG